MHGSEFWGVVRGIQQAGGRDGWVGDGAPGHRAARVRRIGLPLVSLPPSRPALTPAERLFEAIRARIEGPADAALDAQCAHVETIRAAWDRDPERVRALAGWPGLLDALDHLPVLSTA